MARSETYPRPGALPEVRPAGIDEDLARRDFTVSALAVPLADPGALIDHHGGVDDLRAGLLRVLHDRSFVDDPTRALRAARYAARLGFAVEAMTLAQLVEADLPAALPREVFEGLWVTGRGLGFQHLFERHAAIMDPGLVRLGPLAAEVSLAEYLDVLTQRRAFNAAMFAFLEAWDLVVLPTMPITAFAADAEVPEGGEADASLPWITWTPYTYAFNITGQPAITIPCGRGSDGLPVGLQIVGPWARDGRVLDFADACERVLAPGLH
jgi:Asp-tRNA(Asn)/Glu-tRNA(Gln) amidotransferase A subunit family amidase